MFIDGHEGEGALCDLLGLTGARASTGPGLDLDGEGGLAGFDQAAVTGDLISHRDRAQDLHGFDRHRRHTTLRLLGREGRSREVPSATQSSHRRCHHLGLHRAASRWCANEGHSDPVEGGFQPRVFSYAVDCPAADRPLAKGEVS